jgi:hypothetical protein
MVIGLEAASDRDRRNEARRDVDYQAMLWLGGTCLYGTVENLSRGGACLRMLLPLAMQPGECAVLRGDGPLAHGYSARIVGGGGQRWHIAFEHAPVYLDHPELAADPLTDVSEAEVLRVRAQLWRSTIGALAGDKAERAAAKVRELEACADRLRRAETAADRSPDGPGTATILTLSHRS